MVFKLLRTDSDEPCKIQLPVGKHMIGRGKLLDCEDKRVSRNHGELEVLSDTVVIKALHQNPCFVIRKSTEEVQIVKQNCTVNLDNGDKFGLLPNTYWYELLHCAFTDNDKDDSTILSQNEDVDSVATQPMDSGTEPIESGNDTRVDESQVFDFDMNDAVNNDVPGSPSLLPPKNQVLSESPNTPRSRRPYNEDPNPDDETKTPPKRVHSPHKESESEVKRIKTESEIKEEPVVKTEPSDTAAGPSNDQGASSSSKDNDGGSKSPPQQNPLLRERCMYGANCYRKNPQHKAQFSHPSDADWGAGAQAACPWGSACRRADPRHWRDHSHPPGVQQPPAHQARFQPNPGNKRRPKPKKRNDSDDDDEDIPSAVIIQGKRTRKTISRPDTWSGSESENEDPYQTDDSDEWQPTSDMTDSQYDTQDFSQIYDNYK